MPIDFTPGECLELLKYGKFTLLHISGEISSEDAGPITQQPMPRGSEDVKAHYPLLEEWAMLTERFNWGGTSRPNKVYYELWSEGLPEDLETEIKHDVADKLSGYYCGAKITDSNVENRSTHIVASESVDVKLWNCSDPAEDVNWDFTVWYYMFRKEYFDEVLAVLRRRSKLLQQTVNLLRAEIAEKEGISYEEVKPKQVEKLSEIVGGGT